MKVLIAVPCMDQVPAQFCGSLALLRKVGECTVAFKIGSLIYSARNDLARQAVEAEADYMLWLDSDMVFNADLLERMLQSMEQNNADIITGVYFRRVEPYSPVLFNAEGSTYSELTEIPPEPFEVGGCGFGAVLMKMDVMFDVIGKFGDPFTPTSGLGEDLSFCWRARECGYKIIADPSIPLGHVGYQMFTALHWQAFKDRGAK